MNDDRIVVILTLGSGNHAVSQSNSAAVDFECVMRGFARQYHVRFGPFEDSVKLCHFTARHDRAIVANVRGDDLGRDVISPKRGLGRAVSRHLETVVDVAYADEVFGFAARHDCMVVRSLGIDFFDIHAPGFLGLTFGDLKDIVKYADGVVDSIFSEIRPHHTFDVDIASGDEELVLPYLRGVGTTTGSPSADDVNIAHL